MTRDPDLDAAIDELDLTAKQLRHVEEQLVLLDEVRDYRTLARRGHDLADLKRDISTRAERLKIDPRALLLIVEQANRLRRQHKRRPTPAQLDAALLAAADIADRDRVAAAAELVLARNASAHVNTRVKAIADARVYLEASR